MIMCNINVMSLPLLLLIPLVVFCNPAALSNTTLSDEFPITTTTTTTIEHRSGDVLLRKQLQQQQEQKPTTVSKGEEEANVKPLLLKKIMTPIATATLEVNISDAKKNNASICEYDLALVWFVVGILFIIIFAVTVIGPIAHVLVSLLCA